MTPTNRFLRHVKSDSLQPVAGYYEKAIQQGPAINEPAENWGQFTRYLEIGDDLRAVRQMDVFEDGQMLSYDRVHWVDEFGILGDAMINRNRKQGSHAVTHQVIAGGPAEHTNRLAPWLVG